MPIAHTLNDYKVFDFVSSHEQHLLLNLRRNT
jgi:hypothetical protein